jgi:hypothetical protein
MFVPRTPLNLASACFDLRSAFLAVFRARLASLTGLAALKAPGPPTAGTAYDKTKTTARAATESVTNQRTFFSLSLTDCKLLTTAQGEHGGCRRMRISSQNAWAIRRVARGLDDRTPRSLSAPVSLGPQQCPKAVREAIHACLPCRLIHACLPCRLPGSYHELHSLERRSQELAGRPHSRGRTSTAAVAGTASIPPSTARRSLRALVQRR